MLVDFSGDPEEPDGYCPGRLPLPPGRSRCGGQHSDYPITDPDTQEFIPGTGCLPRQVVDRPGVTLRRRDRSVFIPR